MLHRIEMYVINVSVEIGLASDNMVPKTMLPYPPLTVPAVTYGSELPLETMDRIG